MSTNQLKEIGLSLAMKLQDPNSILYSQEQFRRTPIKTVHTETKFDFSILQSDAKRQILDEYPPPHGNSKLPFPQVIDLEGHPISLISH